MTPEAFAAQRRESLTSADDRLEPLVQAGLVDYANGEERWSVQILDEAADIWLENFQAESPGAPYAKPLARFRDMLETYLDRTTQPDVVTEGQVHRITQWLSTYTINAGTTQGAYAHGIRYKRWVTMHDEDVRDIHLRLEGQVRPIGGAFDVGGANLAYPGEPVGPPEGWINCRCVIQPASLTGESMSANTYTFAASEYDAQDGEEPTVATEDAPVVDDTEPIDPNSMEPEDDEEDITEIPIHGVLAPEGVLTGDSRGFRNGALSTRPLPVPYRYEYVSSHGGNQTSQVATVGRVDEAWKDEATQEWRFRGAIILSMPHAAEALSSILNGSGRGVSIDADEMIQDFSEYFDEEGNVREQGPVSPEDAGKPEETWYSSARVAGLTQVPIPAFYQAVVDLGHEFQEDLTPEQIAASAAALEACGCAEGVQNLDEDGDDDEFRDVPTKERKRLADSGNAMPDGSYPIANVDDLRNAIQSAGRAKDPEAVKRHIKKRARALGHPEMIPDGWALDSDPFVNQLLEAMQEPLETFAPGTHDGPGWITHPAATSRIRRYWTHGKGAAKIRWGVGGDFNRCRRQLAKYVQNPEWLDGLCANMHKEALGIWPATHAAKDKRHHALIAAGGIPAPIMTVVRADGGTIYPAAAFEEPGDDHAFPLRIDRETRTIAGYAAEWGSCHVGVAGMCQQAPPSNTDYSYFRKGVVDTDQGEQRVGLITYGIGHAGARASASAATAHYDQTGAVRAYINIGENDKGIWYAGVLAPWVTDADIDAMRAIGRVSGDWRNWSGRANDLEMVGLVVVNTEGFQLAASGGVQTAAIGIGSVPRESLTADADSDANEEFLARAVVKAVQILDKNKRAEEVKMRLKDQRLREVRARLERE